jgi:hypothetical protein
LRNLEMGYGYLMKGDLEDLMASPHLSGLQELHLPNKLMSEDGVRVLARWPRLGQLRCLDLFQNDVRANALRDLLRPNSLTNLVRLNLASNPLGDGIADLGQAECLSALHHLTLTGGSAEAKGIQSLGQSTTLTGLRSLSLYGASVAATRALAQSPLAPQLTNLSLAYSPHREEIATHIAAAPDLSRLHRLELTRCPLGTEGAQALARARFRDLRVLSLTSSTVTAAGVEALATAPALASLVILSLNNHHIGPEGARALAVSPYLTNLTALDLWGSGIGDDGVKYLAASPGMANLTRLVLNVQPIGMEGVRALASSPHMRNLRVLELAQTDLDDAAAEALAASPYLGQLRKLVLCNNPRITYVGLRALYDSATLPNLIAVNVHSDTIDELVPRLARR